MANNNFTKLTEEFILDTIKSDPGSQYLKVIFFSQQKGNAKQKLAALKSPVYKYFGKSSEHMTSQEYKLVVNTINTYVKELEKKYTLGLDRFLECKLSKVVKDTAIEPKGMSQLYETLYSIATQVSIKHPSLRPFKRYFTNRIFIRATTKTAHAHFEMGQEMFNIPTRTKVWSGSKGWKNRPRSVTERTPGRYIGLNIMEHNGNKVPCYEFEMINDKGGLTVKRIAVTNDLSHTPAIRSMEHYEKLSRNAKIREQKAEAKANKQADAQVNEMNLAV